MNLNVKYFDNTIVFNKEFINVLEIENTFIDLLKICILLVPVT